MTINFNVFKAFINNRIRGNTQSILIGNNKFHRKWHIKPNLRIGLLQQDKFTYCCVIALYSTLTLDLNVVCCFLLFYETRFSAIHTQYLVVDLLSNTVLDHYILSPLEDHDLDIVTSPSLRYLRIALPHPNQEF